MWKETTIVMLPSPRRSTRKRFTTEADISCIGSRSTLSLTVIIPAYNEQSTIDAVLQAVRAVPVVSQIVVVDDCSSDNTFFLVQQQAAQDPNLVSVRHDRNRGKGAAIVTGLKHARCAAVVIQDADLEYDPNQLAELLAVMEQKKAAAVYGSRFRGQVRNMRVANRIANLLLTFLANFLYRANITDEATCYKMFRRDVLEQIPLRAKRFDFCPEVTAKLCKRGHRIHEVPICYQARTNAQGKKIRWTDGVEAIWALIKYRFVD